MTAESDVDPCSAPLGYPGRPPDGPAAVVTGRSLVEVRPVAGPIGHWRTGEGGAERPLEEFLGRAGAAPMGARCPVLAVGSNACPAQLRRKFGAAGLPILVPITAVRVSGLFAGVSAHLNRAGYVPATPVADPGAVSALHVIWLAEAELAAMDVTEPNYRRVRLPAAHRVGLPGAGTVRHCWTYASRHGCVVDRASGRPRRLTDQASLIAALLADVPALAAEVAADPGAFAAAAADPGRRDRMRALLAAAGLARPQPEFTAPARRV